jgi:uncharacterized protein (DUF342 family)
MNSENETEIKTESEPINQASPASEVNNKLEVVTPAVPKFRRLHSTIPNLYVEVSLDNLQAFLIIDTDGLDFGSVTGTSIYSLLTSSGLSEEMIKYNKINEIVAKLNKIKTGELQEIVLREEVAVGTPMVPGQDGWVKFYHPHNQRVVIREDGKADYRNLEKYISISKGEKIATMFSGVPGKPGKDIYGNDINAPPILRPKVAIGMNIITDTIVNPEDPEKIYTEYSAGVDGVLFSTDETINVSEELKLNENVGLATGNINYNGSVTINGSIEDGAELTCSGSLMIAENVESCKVDVGNDLIVKGGVKLKNRGTSIKVRGNVRAKFIENAIMEVDGDIVIEGWIINSEIYCLGSVVLTGTGQNNTILGSRLFLYNGLSTYNLGSGAGMDITVELGIHFKNEKLFHEIANSIKNSEKELTELVPKIQQMNNIIKQARGKIDDERKKKYKELVERFQKKNNFHKKLIDKYEELKTTRFNQEKINVIVRGAAYPGATIKYRRQVEKISVIQSSFMMSFFPGQDYAPMTAIVASTKKK